MAKLPAQPTESTIHALLEAVARRDRTARAAADMVNELSYGELTDRVDAYAKSLLAAGVRRPQLPATSTRPPGIVHTGGSL